MKTIKKFVLLFFVFLILFYINSYSQNYYRTTNGYVLVTSNFENYSFVAESHNLAVTYNAVNHTIKGEINLQTFTSEIPFIDSILNSKPMYAIINGYIPVDFLTWYHNEYNLDIPLEIKFNDIKIITLSKIKFSHIDNLWPYTCVMEASFSLKLSDFILNCTKQKDTSIKIQFQQLILRRKDG